MTAGHQEEQQQEQQQQGGSKSPRRGADAPPSNGSALPQLGNILYPTTPLQQAGLVGASLAAAAGAAAAWWYASGRRPYRLPRLPRWR